MDTQNTTNTERELRAITRFFSHKTPKYILMVLDDERILNYLIVRLQLDLKKKKKELLHLRLSDADSYVFRQVKDFLEDNRCDGLVITNLNMLIYKYAHECIDLLNKSRDAFAKFPIPLAFVVNSDSQKKIFNDASDFYQLRALPDFHFEGKGTAERDILNISFREFNQVKDSDLKVSLLEEQLKIVTEKQRLDENAVNNIVVPLLAIYSARDDFKKVKELFDRHIKGKEGLVKEKIVLGDCYYHMFDFEKAIDFYTQALDYYRKLKDTTQIIACYMRLGTSYLELGSYDEAKSLYEKSLAIGKIAGDSLSVAVSLHEIGIIYHKQGRFDEASQYYTQSLEIKEKIGDIKGVSASLHQIGMIYQEKNDYDVALKYYRQSLEISEKIGAINNIGTSLHNIGAIYQESGDNDEALKYYLQSLEIKEKIGDIEGVAITMNQIGSIYFEKKNYTDALKLAVRSFNIFLKIGSPYASKAKQSIDLIREKLPKEEVEEIMKEFAGPSKTGSDS